MTFTIQVPIFPMRKEIAERRQRRAAAMPDAGSARARPRDVEGFIELELLPLDELDALGTHAARAQRRNRRS